MKKRILVTGGLGFIGSNYVRYVIDHNHVERVTLLDNLTYAGCPANYDPKYLSDIDLVLGDICDLGAVKNALVDAEAVVHFAAESHVDRSILDGTPFVKTNVLGTFTLLNCALEHFEQLSPEDRRHFRFMNISTDEVYGALEIDGYFTENSPLRPNSPYSASKAAADCLARAMFHTYDFPVITTRCSNNYGPYQFPEKFLPVIILNALSNRPVPVYGQGKNVRDWIHVEDHCAGIQSALDRGKAGSVYNFGGESEMVNLETARKVLNIVKKPESLIQFVDDRKGHDFRYAIKIEKARELGWSPKIGFDEGLRRTVKWYEERRDWWQPILDGKYQDLRSWKVRKVA